MQQQIDSGGLGKTAAYELSKLRGEPTLNKLAANAKLEDVTARQAASLVNQRRGKSKRSNTKATQSFLSETGVRVTVYYGTDQNYHDLLEALEAAVEEVRLRIDNNVHLT